MFMINKLISLLAPMLLIFSFISCGGGSSSDEPELPPATNTCATDLASLEQSIHNDLNNTTTDTDFTLLLTSADGKQFEHNTGDSNKQTIYRSASTSKFVTAAIILSSVNNNLLSLDSKPQDFIGNWPSTGNLSDINLTGLLSFSSGLSEDPLCIHLSGSDFSACIDSILSSNLSNNDLNGEVFDYGAAHMQVAGQMVINALNADSWQTVFSRFKNETGLFTSSTYDLPSSNNPRLAAGMHWTGEEYLQFLKAIFDQTILTPELIITMTSDQISTSSIAYSPALEGINEDWHYGLGNWIECHSSTFNCDQVTRVSSPGAYGAYPFIDYENNYYGILAREGELGTFDDGYALFSSISEKLEQWAAKSCP